ncbi:MAG: ATP-binding protein, partial [Chloroflexota bacterium]|nr:ATP-binding protein [Chloroflexota bacterium]
MNDLLKGLGLTALAHDLPMLLDDARQQQLSYEAFLQRALGAEVTGRRERALQRRLRAARLPTRARLERFDYSFQPTLSERLVRELAGLSFVQTATNVIFLGPPGVGKTHLASGLAARAVEGGYT